MSLPFRFLLPGLLLLLPGCYSSEHFRPRYALEGAPAHSRVRDEASAIAVVQRALQRRHEDPATREFHARRQGEGWYVTAWRLVSPQGSGAGRFVPGGFTTFLVNDAGRIVETWGGA